jgi:hypothetical protein
LKITVTDVMLEALLQVALSESARHSRELWSLALERGFRTPPKMAGGRSPKHRVGNSKRLRGRSHQFPECRSAWSRSPSSMTGEVFKMEPEIGLEPTTTALRKQSSTTELLWRLEERKSIASE